MPVQAELSDAITSLIPDRYTNVIVIGAIARFKMYEGVPEAIEYQAKYTAAFQDMKKELITQFTPIKPTFFGRYYAIRHSVQNQKPTEFSARNEYTPRSNGDF